MLRETFVAGDGSRDFYGIDDIRFVNSGAPVPIPASAGLGLVGMIGVGGLMGIAVATLLLMTNAREIMGWAGVVGSWTWVVYLAILATSDQAGTARLKSGGDDTVAMPEFGSF